MQRENSNETTWQVSHVLIFHLLAICFYPVDIDPRTRPATAACGVDDGDGVDGAVKVRRGAVSIDDYTVASIIYIMFIHSPRKIFLLITRFYSNVPFIFNRDSGNDTGVIKQYYLLPNRCYFLVGDKCEIPQAVKIIIFNKHDASRHANQKRYLLSRY